MRVKTLVLCSSSLAILAATPALAQTEAAPQAQSNPAQPAEQTAAQTDDAVTNAGGAGGEEIVVTGLRQSLRSAQNIKRNSAQIIDAIVAEDIGKLPDIAVSDTAARIPGVQVDRGGGEASRVLVRGLPDFATTYNGREIFTAERRSVALQDFPSGAIGAIEVFKTSTADLVEPGLAGLVNVRSHRPFDFKGLEVAGSVWGLYPKQSQKITPNGNLLISDRWEVGGGEIGALIDFSYTELQYLDSERSNTDFVADPNINGQVVRFPDIQRIFYGSGNRVRPSINGALQWRPMPGLEFYAEGLWQGFRNKISDHQISVPLWGGAQYSNIVLQPGTNLVQSGTVVNPFRPDGFQGGTYNKTNTYQFAVGGSYDAGPLRVTADIARTKSTFTGSTASVDYAFANQQTVNFNTDVPRGDGGNEFSFASFDPGNPANYIYRGFYEEAQQAKGDDWQARLDVQYETGIGFLPRIDAGIRYVARDAHREFGNRYWNFEGNRIPITQVPLDYELFHSGFRGSNIQQDFRNWLAPTYSSIRDNLVEMRRFNIALGGTQFGPASETPVVPDPLQTYDAHEKTTAAYAQLSYEFGSTIRVDGHVGLRAVKTDETINGTSRTDQASGPPVFSPVTGKHNYTDWLPNADARIRFTNELQLRLSYAETRTRPNYADLNPTTTLGAPPSNCNPTGDPFSCARTGNAGNPSLLPFTSNNYDASLEYYFSRSGFASAAIFRRDLNGFFQGEQLRINDPVLGPVIINRQINAGKGRIDGFEAQTQTFFDWGFLPDWAKGFGVQANVTYLDPKTNGVRILGVSKWSYNLVGMYEHGGLSARLAYNYRSGYPVTFQARGDGPYSEHARPISRLDLSTSYTVIENLTVFFDWTNILGKPFRSTLTSNRNNTGEVSFPRFVRYEETIFSAGIRFRF